MTFIGRTPPPAGGGTPTTAVGYMPFAYGAQTITSGANDRYLQPVGDYNASAAETTELGWEAQVAVTLKRLTIIIGTGAGNGNDVIYTVNVDGLPTGLTLTIPSTSAGTFHFSLDVPVAADAIVSLHKFTALSIGSSPLYVQAFVQVEGPAVGAGGSSCPFVFRYVPEKPAPLASNEFDTWVPLITALAGCEGEKVVEVDASFMAVPIPPAGGPRIPTSAGEPGGAWNMNGSILSSPQATKPGTPPNTLTGDDGAEVVGLWGLQGNVGLSHTAVAPARGLVRLGASQDTFFVRESAQLIASFGDQPTAEILGENTTVRFFDLASVTRLPGGGPFGAALGIPVGDTSLLTLELVDAHAIAPDTIVTPLAAGFTVFSGGNAIGGFSHDQPRVTLGSLPIRFFRQEDQPYFDAGPGPGIVILRSPGVSRWQGAVISSGSDIELPFASESCGPYFFFNDPNGGFPSGWLIFASGIDTINGSPPPFSMEDVLWAIGYSDNVGNWIICPVPAPIIP